ncbi:hypothetical protein TWF506_005887 [Arthrobotrys conoides]|uniref:Ankyrin repeat domain-containing protein n=1 Tax=Arthrobotrys conoides TaxID=74498 RepID=A0AAN8NUH1_9PEZI
MSAVRLIYRSEPLDKIVKLLLDRGADPSFIFEDTAELSVIDEELFELLLDRGADPNYVSRNGSTALELVMCREIADKYGDKVTKAGIIESDPVVKLLLEKGCDPNHLFKDGRTALALAASIGATSVVKLLLKSGADPTAKSRDKTTALSQAILYGQESTATILRRAMHQLARRIDSEIL